MDHFTIENEHIKSYTIMVTDWNDGPYDRVPRPHVIPFDHNLPVSALVEQLRQELLVKEPNVCMTGDLHLRKIQEPSLDNEALLKDVIPQPEDQLLHANCHGIERSRDHGTNSTSVSRNRKKAASAARTREDLATFAKIRKASRTQQNVPDEIILFAIDTSDSMRWPADFSTRHRYDDEIWLTQDPEASPDRYLSYQRGSLRSKEAITSMPFQELRGVFSKEASFEDLLAILHLQSEIDQETRASSILKHIQILFTRQRRHHEELIIKALENPETDIQHQQEYVYNVNQYHRLTQLMMGLVEHDSHLVNWLCECASSKFKESTWRWTFGNEVPETSGSLPPATLRPKELALIKVYHGRDHINLFSYWIKRSDVHLYASVIFRYRRYLAEERGQDFDEDVDVWTEIRYVGDGRCVGRLNSHWDTIPCGELARSTGILGPEPLYSKPEDPLQDDSNQDIMVLKMHVESHDYQQRMDEAENQRKESVSRLLISQTFVDAFLDRALAYNLNCHIGIVTSNSCASSGHRFTSEIQDLHGSINAAQPDGDTDICEILSEVSKHLLEYAVHYPTARKRIICLSDCLALASFDTTTELVPHLVKSQIVVDSVSFSKNNSALQAITWLSGGDHFVPKTNDEVLAIAQLEPFLSQLQREPLPQPRQGTVDEFRVARSAGQHKSIRATPDERPLRPSPPALDHQFLEPGFALLKNTKALNAAPRDIIDVLQPGPANHPHNRNARVRTELRRLYDNRGGKFYRVFVCEEDITFWQVVISPKITDASLYGRGVWVFHLDMQENYPLSPPDVRFKTSIHHLNVNLDGRVCHRLLYQDWNPQTTNIQIIEAVLSILVRPRLSDAINLTAMRQRFKTGLYACEYEDEIQRQIRKYARRSMESWVRAIKLKMAVLPEEGPQRKYHESIIAHDLKLSKPAQADDDGENYEEQGEFTYAALETDTIVPFGE